MENNSEKLNLNCGICDAKNARFWFEKNSFNLYKCGKCGLIFTESIPDVSKIYSEDYFSGAKNGFGYVDYDKDKVPMVGAFNHFLNIIEKFSVKKGKLLDVGAASGFFLELAKKREWDVSGVEISEFAASRARERGLNVKTGIIEDFNADDSKHFSVITMWDVIEHVHNPVSAISKAGELLEDGGIIAINTPDSGSLVAKILGKRWYKFIPPEHVIYFNQNNLCLLLSKIGFKVVYAGKIRKKFTLQYLFNMLARWQNIFIWQWVADLLAGTRLGSISLPVDLRDDFFVIAKKS